MMTPAPALMRPASFFLVLVVSIAGCAGSVRTNTAGEAARALPTDFDGLIGPMWRGTLTYLDYTSGKPTTIPSSLAVTKDGPGAWKVAFGYDDEPHSNAASVLRVIDDGAALLNGDTRERVVLRRAGSDEVAVTTEFTGTDNDRPATIRKMYTVAAGEASLRKMVRFDGEAEFITRHEYRWRRQ